jgi:putative ABC transport system permease protein
MALQVTSRTREIGVRMALGADRARVVRMVLGQSLAVAAAGVIMGVPLALAAAKALEALLYGVAPFAPAQLALAVGVLIAVGLVATLVPSRNAARVDPLIAMRAE